MEVIFVILSIFSLKWYMIHQFLEVFDPVNPVAFTGEDDRSYGSDGVVVCPSPLDLIPIF